MESELHPTDYQPDTASGEPPLDPEPELRLNDERFQHEHDTNGVRAALQFAITATIEDLSDHTTFNRKKKVWVPELMGQLEDIDQLTKYLLAHI